MKTKILTFIAATCLTITAVAQKPTVKLLKTLTPINLDGELDAVWGKIDSLTIENNVTNADIVDPAYWKACWNDNGIYVVVVVSDNSYWPAELSGKESWQSDKPEVYFDVNEVLEDNVGASSKIASGHYQLAPTFSSENDGQEQIGTGEDEGCKYAHKVTGANYVFEYFIPFALLSKAPDFLQTRPIGFDVTVIDLDEGAASENRKTWANKEAKSSSWNNMDDCGIITLSSDIIATAIDNRNIDLTYAYISNNKLKLFGIKGMVKIYNLSGELLLQAKANGRDIDVSHLYSGIYILKADNFTGKLFKQSSY